MWKKKKRRKSARAACREAPNCLLQHVMTSLLHINLSLLRAISGSMQEANRFIFRRETLVCPLTKQKETRRQ